MKAYPRLVLGLLPRGTRSENRTPASGPASRAFRRSPLESFTGMLRSSTRRQPTGHHSRRPGAFRVTGGSACCAAGWSQRGATTDSPSTPAGGTALSSRENSKLISEACIWSRKKPVLSASWQCRPSADTAPTQPAGSKYPDTGGGTPKNHAGKHSPTSWEACACWEKKSNRRLWKILTWSWPAAGQTPSLPGNMLRARRPRRRRLRRSRRSRRRSC
mmetsp:Transcript_92275/g.246749  ORF Transcript_92275/g.246749 Transcript_92275/m.246749 type:complete len:217 (+) Transcript_92275:296-946(+)